MRTLITAADEICANALEAHARHEIPADEARSIIAGALLNAGIATAVAGERYVTSAQLRHDLVEEMNDLLVSKILKSGPGTYDLDLGRNRSATGWARQLQRAARNGDVPLTPALHSTCEIGQQIPVEFYDQIAGVLAFIMALRTRGQTKGIHTVPKAA